MDGISLEGSIFEVRSVEEAISKEATSKEAASKDATSKEAASKEPTSKEAASTEKASWPLAWKLWGPDSCNYQVPGNLIFATIKSPGT